MEQAWKFDTKKPYNKEVNEMKRVKMLPLLAGLIASSSPLWAQMSLRAPEAQDLVQQAKLSGAKMKAREAARARRAQDSFLNAFKKLDAESLSLTRRAVQVNADLTRYIPRLQSALKCQPASTSDGSFVAALQPELGRVSNELNSLHAQIEELNGNLGILNDALVNNHNSKLVHPARVLFAHIAALEDELSQFDQNASDIENIIPKGPYIETTKGKVLWNLYVVSEDLASDDADGIGVRSQASDLLQTVSNPCSLYGRCKGDQTVIVAPQDDSLPTGEVEW